MKKNKKGIVFIATLIIAIECIFLIGCNLSPGSYADAEKYVLPYPENEVKKAITNFKLDHPEYNVPKVTINNQGSLDLIDEPTADPGYWYKFYFYFENNNQIILTWIRSVDENNTTFAFVSVNSGLDLGNWKDINKDFGSSENEEMKRKFEELILSKVKESLKK